ncbi:uncharacterized protein [Palaemon carinicauda]|uniref:uncharacterized protein n=1 Tax=Palaemon carinicauda TaxID=392227 RepID=UPI0035B65DDD
MAVKHDFEPPRLIINNTPIEWVNDYRYLGIMINRHLSPTSQVKYLKHRISTRFAAMKRITSLSRGASHLLLRRFYVQAIASQVEYAAPSLTGLQTGLLSSLEVIQNNGMRLITGAPMWTRLQLLRAETNLMPLANRVDIRLCATVCKTIKAGRASPLSNKLRAPWVPDPISTNFTVLPSTKALCPPQILLQAANQAVRQTWANNNYFTDGSVDRSIPATGAAVVSNNYVANWRLSDHASTLQTELVAIAKALADSLGKQGDTTIHTDSKGAIQAISNNKLQENVRLLSTIRATAQIHAQRGRKITLNWIPSHVGVQGNEAADRLANEALKCTSIGVSLSKSLKQIKNLLIQNCLSRVRSDVRDAALGGSMTARWYTQVTDMDPHDITRDTNRRIAVITHRLRLGYKCCWQIIGDEVRPCQHCEAQPAGDPLDHYLLHCPSTVLLRQDLPNHPPITAEAVTKNILENIPAYTAYLSSYPPPR